MGKKQIRGLLSFELTVMPKNHKSGLNKPLAVQRFKTTLGSLNLQKQKAGSQRYIPTYIYIYVDGCMGTDIVIDVSVDI